MGNWGLLETGPNFSVESDSLHMWYHRLGFLVQEVLPKSLAPLPGVSADCGAFKGFVPLIMSSNRFLILAFQAFPSALCLHCSMVQLCLLV